MFGPSEQQVTCVDVVFGLRSFAARDDVASQKEWISLEKNRLALKVSRRNPEEEKNYFGGCWAGVVNSFNAFLLGIMPGTLGSVLTWPVTASSILML